MSATLHYPALTATSAIVCKQGTLLEEDRRWIQHHMSQTVVGPPMRVNAQEADVAQHPSLPDGGLGKGLVHAQRIVVNVADETVAHQQAPCQLRWEAQMAVRRAH